MKILITKLSALGDIVQAWPVLDYIKAKFPDAQIDWAVDRQNRELVESHPLVSSAICIDTHRIRKHLFQAEGREAIRSAWDALRNSKYDYIFDLQSNMKSALCVLAASGKRKIGWKFSDCAEWPAAAVYTDRYAHFGVKSARSRYLELIQRAFDDKEPYTPKAHLLRLSEMDREFVQKQLSALSKPLWIVCPGSKWKNKVYPFEKLVLVIEELIKRFDVEILYVTGGGVESRMVDEMSPRHRHMVKPSLPALQHLMAASALMIGMDSLPIHLSDSVQTPTFALFGPTQPEVYFPPNNTNRAAFRGICPYGKEFSSRCPIMRSCPTGACIRDIPPNIVVEQITSWLKTVPF